MLKIPFSLGIVHFCGIGGIGMSGIAEVMHHLGYNVQGSDISDSNNVQRLRKLGIKIFIGQNKGNLKNVDVLVASSDIPEDNPEYAEALNLQIPIVRRAQMLGELMKLKHGICIAGTHGKTTTTSLAGTLLDVARFDPTIVNGGIINAYGTNARLGESEWIVVEADESDGSFLFLPSIVSIVTNIDLDHMEHYKTEKALIDTFSRFIEKLPFWGYLIACLDDERLRNLLPQVKNTQVLTYGFHDDSQIQGCNIHTKELGSRFDVRIKMKNSDERLIEGVAVSLIGEHNIQNALSIVALAQVLKISDAVLKQALSSFSGVKRRFTHVGYLKGAKVIDDYAHHPVEIAAVLKAAKSVCEGKIFVVFQPHRYSRFSLLYKDFLESFHDADYLLVTPIYSAGEEILEGFSNEKFVRDINHKDCSVVQNFEDAKKILLGDAQENDLILCLGAGSITMWAKDLGEGH